MIQIDFTDDSMLWTECNIDSDKCGELAVLLCNVLATVGYAGYSKAYVFNDDDRHLCRVLSEKIRDDIYMHDVEYGTNYAEKNHLIHKEDFD